jgi:hypothetical protein
MRDLAGEIIVDLPMAGAKRAGFACAIELPLGYPLGDVWSDVARSRLVVLEDGRALGPAHATYQQVIDQGQGRFYHWAHNLFFSSSDNSNPLTNGRRYQLRLPEPAHPDTSPSAQKARYQIHQAECIKALFRMHDIPLHGTSLLELGPGDNLGAQLLLASSGVEVTVADPYLCRWQDDHAAIYRHILGTGYGPAGALERAVHRNGHDGLVRALAEPAENMLGLADGSVDVVVSNAALEHVRDIAAVARELARVSRPGAWQFHQIDLRDHRDFTRPLEHLLMPRAEFQAVQEASRWERGCQWRLSEIRSVFEEAGLETIAVYPEPLADEDYFQDFLRRLRGAGVTYAGWPEEDLRITSVRIVSRAWKRS